MPSLSSIIGITLFINLNLSSDYNLSNKHALIYLSISTFYFKDYFLIKLFTSLAPFSYSISGMFIVRLIGINMGEVVAGEVICGLWNNYSLERRSIAEKSGRKNAAKNRTNVPGQRLEVV